MKRSIIQTTILLCVCAIVLSLGLRIWYVESQREASHSTESEDLKRGELVRIEGYQASNYIKGDLTSHIEADLLVIAPHRVSIFKIRLYDRFTLKNARIALHTEYLDHLPSFLPFEKLESLQRGEINGLVLSFHKSGVPTVQVTAQSAEINRNKDTITLERVIIEELASHKKIAGRTAFWTSRDKLLNIPGAYFAQDGTKKITGEGLKIGPTFKFNKQVFSD